MTGEERAARLRERAAAARGESESRLARAQGDAETIPLGQPILVGHYSEGRDRRFRARISANYSKAFEAQKEAEALERRARVRVAGWLKQDRWTDKDGIERQKVKIMADHIEFKPEIKPEVVESSEAS